LASSIPTRWSASPRGCWCRVGPFAPRAICIYATSRPASPGRRGEHPGLASMDRGAGAVTGFGCGGWRRAIAAASIRPSTKPPGKWSPLLCGTRSAPCSLATRRVSPARLRAGDRTFADDNGDAPTLSTPYGTRPNEPALSSGWWTSAGPPPPALPANSASPNPEAADSPVRIATSRATATL